MSRSNWGIRAAIVAVRGYWPKPVCNWLIASCIAFTLSSAAYHASKFLIPGTNQYETADPEYYSRRCEAEKTDRLYGLKAIETPSNSQSDGDKKKHETPKKPEKPNYCDLAAQYIAARAAESGSYYSLIGVWLTFVGVVSILITMKLTHSTLGQAISATEAAHNVTEVTRKIGDIQNKAYLGLKNFEAHPKATDDDPRYLAIIKNYGKSPAFHCKIRLVSIEGRYTLEEAVLHILAEDTEISRRFFDPGREGTFEFTMPDGDAIFLIDYFDVSGRRISRGYKVRQRDGDSFDVLFGDSVHIERADTEKEA